MVIGSGLDGNDGAQQEQMERMDSAEHWYPTEIRWSDGAVELTWHDFGSRRFSEPFFHDALTRAVRDKARVRHSGIESLRRFETVDCLEPTAFIFHASRCGSTLITQVLNTLPGFITMSEPPAVDRALALCRSEGRRGEGIDLLRSVVRALGQRRYADERHLVVKLDSWHITQADDLRSAFPGVPCVFLYRDPGEILASHRGERGRQMVPGLVEPGALGVDPSAVHPADLEGYAIQVLISLFTRAHVHAAAHDMALMNHSELPGGIWERLLPGLGVELNEKQLEVARERTTRHSKRPHDPFCGDRPTPPTIAGLEGEDDPERLTLDRAYRALQALRVSQGDGVPWALAVR
ncbi:MAG: hypothetical protein ACPGU7_10535 [Gammaproteobacteria bacterium]